MDLIRQLLSPDFMPHGYCYLWDPWIVWLHVVSDGLITLSYYAIPAPLIYLARKRRDLPFHWPFWMFSLFIASCGTAHLMEIWNVWHASYLASGVIKAITAATSVVTAVALLPLLPKAIALPSPEQFRIVNLQLKSQIAERDRAYTELAIQKSTVAEVRTAQEALRDSQAQLSAIVQSAMDAIITLNSDHRIVLFNATAEKMFGCSATEAIGQSIDRFIPQRFRLDHVGHVRRFAETGVTNRAMGRLPALWALRANGEEFPVESSISQVVVGGQKLFTVILRDITDRRRAELELANKVEELARSNLDLEQFAYVASHDLQEPLRMVAAYTQLLGERYACKLDENANKYIHHAMEGALRMQTLVQDLLTFSRVGRNRQRTEIAADDALKEALKNLSSALQESGAAVHCDGLPTVYADRTQLVQLFQNLIGNAIKFRGEKAPMITVSAEQLPEWVFSVRDNGIGIAPQHLESIFVIFQRLHTRAEYPGNGVGLAICKKIVEQHGGRIWVESQPQLGSAFKFTLPVNFADGERNHTHEGSA